MKLADAGDASAISLLAQATFAETFEHLYDPKDLQTFLEAKHSVGFYEAVMARPDCQIWGLKSGDKLFGYCMVTDNSLPCDPPRPDALELSRLYLSSEMRGQGWGSRLIDKVIEYARGKGYPEIVLSVFSENHGGIRLYTRHGFQKIGEYDFPVGDHLDREWIMCRPVD